MVETEFLSLVHIDDIDCLLYLALFQHKLLFLQKMLKLFFCHDSFYHIFVRHQFASAVFLKYS